MSIKDILPNQQKDHNEYYWSLIVEPGWIQAGIWYIEDSQTKVLSVSPSSAWTTESELNEAADSALSAAVQGLPDDAPEPSKAVFGVSSGWVKQGSITSEYLEKIKNLCTSLSLVPAGFVVMPEAVAHYFKSKEGSPLNAVVLGISNEILEVSVFKLGKPVGVQSVARSVSVSEDVIEGLSRFNEKDSLPSRFLIYNGREAELEEAKQSLLRVNWNETDKIKFLHTPNIEIVNLEDKVLAVSLAGASEIANVSSVKVVAKPDETKVVEQNENKEATTGFVVGQDIAQSGPQTNEHDNNQEHPQEEPKPFPKAKTPGIFTRLTKIMGGAKKTLEDVKPKVKKANLGASAGKKTFVFGGVVLAIVFIGSFSYWWFYPKATVNIIVTPKRLEEKVSLFIDPDMTVPDVSGRKIPGKSLKTSVSGERTQATTGAKTIGEKAKGSVKIQNGTSSDIDLDSGTVVSSTGGFDFVIDSAVTVSAAFSPSSPGTASVNVTAGDIGAEYNLAQDETFSIGNYPKADVDAVASADFSGGSSRQILAVSQEDVDNLKEDLIDELLIKAKGELKSGLPAGAILIEESEEYTIKDSDYSDKQGDEAENVSLSLDLAVTALSAEQKDLVEIANSVLEGKIPDGFVLRESQIDTDFQVTDETGGVYEVETVFNVNLLPEVNPEDIAKKILGKYPPLAQEYLVTVPGFRRAEISLRPKFPGRLGTLPHVLKNLTVELEADR